MYIISFDLYYQFLVHLSTFQFIIFLYLSVAPEVERSHIGTFNSRKLRCTLKRAYPPANFLWQYQPLYCDDEIKCSLNKSWVNVSHKHYKVEYFN